MDHSGCFEPCWSFENVSRIGGGDLRVRRRRRRRRRMSKSKNIYVEIKHTHTHTHRLCFEIFTTTCNYDDFRAKTGRALLSFFLSFLPFFFFFWILVGGWRKREKRTQNRHLTTPPRGELFLSLPFPS
jgi:hypothetical protein